MPLPPDHQYVSAADAGPGAPFTQIECPSDDAAAAAADIRRVAAVALANQEAIQIERYTWSYDVESPPFSFVTFSTTSYVPPGSGGVLDVLNAQVGDVVYARLIATVQNENAAPTGNGNRLRLAAIDDLGGGGETAPAAVLGARAYIGAPMSQMTPLAIEGEWVVTVDGTTRIQVEGRVDVGAGQQLILQSAVYMIAIHTRKL